MKSCARLYALLLMLCLFALPAQARIDNPASGSGGSGTPGGSTTQVQFNSGGTFGGSSGLTYNAATGALTATSFSGSGAGLTNLPASVAGSNTQVQLNDHGVLYASSGLTFNSASGATSMRSSSSSALAVGRNGATNPAFVVDSSTSAQAAGLQVQGATSAGTVNLNAISSGSNASVLIQSKGNGNFDINGNFGTTTVNGGTVAIKNAGTTRFLTSGTGAELIGKIGVGTASPAAALDVVGAIKLADNSQNCSHSTDTGAQRFNSVTNTMQFCKNGAGWTDIAGPTIFACDGTDQTTAISTLLSTDGSYVFTGTCRTGSIVWTGKNLTIDFAQNAVLEPYATATPSAPIDLLWRCNGCNLHFVNLKIDGLKSAHTALYYDGSSAIHTLIADNVNITNMGADVATSTNIVTGFELRSIAAGSFLKIGKFVQSNSNSIGDGSCGDAVGSVRAIYLQDVASLIDIGYFEAYGGTDIEDNDFFHSQTNNAGGTIHNLVARYNGNTRRIFKAQSGHWTIVHTDVREGSDFVIDTSLGGTQIGKYNLNAFDWASPDAGGSIDIQSGYIDCRGFGTCIAAEGASAVHVGSNVTLLGPKKDVNRSATACNTASTVGAMGFYSATTDVGSGLDGTTVINFGRASILQGKQSFVKNATYIDPVDEVAELAYSGGADGIEFSGNRIITQTPTFISSSNGVVRALKGTHLKIANNILIEDGNTTHASNFFKVTDAAATGNAWNNTAPLNTTEVNNTTGSVVKFDSAGVQLVAGGGTGAATLTGLVVGNGTSAMTAGNLSGVVTSSGLVTSLGSFTSANLSGALTDETGTGAATFGTAPTLTSANITFASAGAISGAEGFQAMLPMVSGKFMFMGPWGATLSTAAASALVTNTEYATLNIAPAPISIHSIGIRTASTNVSTGDSVKICVYAADGAQGHPKTLLGSTATGTAIGDSAASTDVSITLDANTAVPAGPFWVAILNTFVTTGVRVVDQSGTLSAASEAGAATHAAVFGGTPTLGYTMAQTYSNGCASPFSASPTANTNVNLAPAFSVELH